MEAKKPYTAEVVADSTGKFLRNGLSFDTYEEAATYVRDLSWRWTLVTDTRVLHNGVVVTGPVEAVVEG